MGVDAVVLQRDGLDVGRVGKHRDHHVGPTDGLGHAARTSTTGIHEALHRLFVRL